MSYVHLIVLVAVRTAKGRLLLLLENAYHCEVHVAVLIVEPESCFLE